MRHLLIILFSLLLLLSCNTKETIPKQPFQLLLPDTIKNEKNKAFIKWSKDLSGQLNLNKLDKGVDSLELRIWITGFVQPYQLITIRNLNKNWVATNTFFWMESTEPDSIATYTLTPKKKIEQIIDTLKEFDIVNIPSQVDISNFRDNVADGFYYTIEIADKNYYKLIGYHCPDVFVNDQYNSKVTALLLFIRRNLVGFMMCKE